MAQEFQSIQRNGEEWTIRRLHNSEQEDADFEFWFQMTPEQRVMAVAECTESCLKAKGKTAKQPFQQVYRRVKRKSSQIE